MQKPEVRVVEYQQEEIKDVEVSQSERDYLLSKYGYIQSKEIQNDSFAVQSQSNYTFEEMIEMEERKLKSLKEERQKNNLRGYSFDNVSYSESKYTSLDLDGSNYGVQVQIMSDMPINNRNC